MNEFDLTRRVLDDGRDDEAALERVRHRLSEAIAAEPVRRLPPPWRALPVAAAIGLLVAVVVALFPGGREAAATELRRLGRIASGQDRLQPGPGGYLLIRSEELRRESHEDLATGISFEYVTRLSISTWLASDGSGFRLEEERLTDFASEADRAAWIAAERPVLDVSRTDRFEPGEAPLMDVTDLPADPDRLLAMLRSGAVAERPPGDEQVFILIGELLARGDAAPEVRQALFEVAARLEGVQLVGPVEDPLGRPGVGVSIASVTGASRLVFDQESAQLLSIELYDEGASIPRSWIAAHPTTVVDEAPRLEG